MTEEQIKMLRFIIKQEIEAAGIDSMEHGVWGWAEKQLDENWEEFKKSFEAQQSPLLMSRPEYDAKLLHTFLIPR